jgi:hypothetical protein
VIASAWSSLVDVALGGAAFTLLYLLRLVWRLEARLEELETRFGKQAEGEASKDG